MSTFLAWLFRLRLHPHPKRGYVLTGRERSARLEDEGVAEGMAEPRYEERRWVA